MTAPMARCKSLSSVLVALAANLFITDCARGAEVKTMTFGDTTYEYVVIPQKITDLTTDMLNQTFIETNYCFIRYDRKFEAILGEIIATTEREYLRVARDLQFNPRSRKPGVAVMSSGPYREATPDGSGGYFPGKRGKHADFAYINADQWPPGSEKLAQMIAHELTHWIFFQLRGRKSPEKIGAIRGYLHSLRAFEEALAQYIDGRPVDLKERLSRHFPDGRFLSIAEVDSSLDPVTELSATIQFQVLIPLLASHNGKNELPGIVRRLAKRPMDEALREQLGDEYPAVMRKWFFELATIAETP